MHYFLRCFLLVAIFVQYIPLTSHAEGSYYLVSAYYSPVEGQEFYLHGTYEDEIKMNGEGKNTASGKPVQIGVVAAPKEIAFHTRVHIKQTITINGKPYTLDFHGTVLDRGGAIHSASKLPRLDIYMGKGQEGLCRAINFGVQTVYVDLDTDTSIPNTNNFAGISSTCSNPNNETVALSSGIKLAFDPFTMPIGTGSASEDIKTVQKLLTRVNAYTGPINGAYDEKLTDAIFSFQKANGIVKEKSDEGAGNYGPKTRSMLKALLSGELNKTTNATITNTGDASTDSPSTNTTSSGTDSSSPTITQQGLISREKSEVEEIQKKLKELGYFKFEIDGVYNKRLVDSLYAFQLAKKIVTGEDDPGAGYYGPVTETAINDMHNAFTARREELNKLENELEIAKKALAEVHEKKKQEFVAMINKIPTVKLGGVDPEIRTLQKLLKEVGYFNQKDTAIFGEITKGALAKYQLALKVIDSLNSPYAGILGEKTRAAIAEDLFNRWAVKDTESTIEVERIQAEIDALKKI